MNRTDKLIILSTYPPIRKHNQWLTMDNNNIDVCHCPHLQNISPAPVSCSPPASGRTVCDRTLCWGRADGRVSASSLLKSLLGPRHNTSNTTHLSSFYISEFHKSEAEWFTKKNSNHQDKILLHKFSKNTHIHFLWENTRHTHFWTQNTQDFFIPKYPRLLHFDSVSQLLRLISYGKFSKVHNIASTINCIILDWPARLYIFRCEASL